MKESMQKAERIKELMRRLEVRFRQMVTTDPPTGEMSLFQASKEAGVDFGLVLAAAANFDLSPIVVRESKTPESRTSEERVELSACVSMATLRQWLKKTREDASSHGLGIDDYLRQRHFGVSPPDRSGIETVSKIEKRMDDRGMAGLFRSAISNGDIALVDGRIDPRSFERWEKGLMKMGKTINLEGVFSVSEVVSLVPDVKKNSLEVACSAGRVEGATKGADGWVISATSFARWYNEAYRKHGGKEFVIVTPDYDGVKAEPKKTVKRANKEAPVKEGGPVLGVETSSILDEILSGVREILDILRSS